MQHQSFLKINYIMHMVPYFISAVRNANDPNQEADIRIQRKILN